jgi:hypothetical protein
MTACWCGIRWTCHIFHAASCLGKTLSTHGLVLSTGGSDSGGMLAYQMEVDYTSISGWARYSNDWVIVYALLHGSLSMSPPYGFYWKFFLCGQPEYTSLDYVILPNCLFLSRYCRYLTLGQDTFWRATGAGWARRQVWIRHVTVKQRWPLMITATTCFPPPIHIYPRVTLRISLRRNCHQWSP